MGDYQPNVEKMRNTERLESSLQMIVGWIAKICVARWGVVLVGMFEFGLALGKAGKATTSSEIPFGGCSFGTL
jgi:hypothetical protein